jgi:hypothetical protein
VNTGNAPSLTVDALRGDMATHRRGLRPAQWPVRDLLAEQRSRMGALRDPRLYAAVGGLLACGAAATVAFTASDGAHGHDAVPGPMALPAPNSVVPAPANPAPSDPAPSDPAPSDPAPSDPAPSPADGGSVGGVGAGPVPRAWRSSVDDSPATVTVPADDAARSASVREIADRVAAELVRLQARSSSDGTVEGLLVVPVQRDGKVTALLKRVRTAAAYPAGSERTGGRHRAREASDTRDGEQGGDRKHADDRKHDSAKHDGKKRDRKHDRKHSHDGKHADRKHSHDEDGKHADGKHADRKHGHDEDGKHADGKHADRKHGHDEDGKHADSEHAQREHRDDGDERASSTRPVEHPAITALVTAGHGDRGPVPATRSIDSAAMLAALDDVEGSTTSRR